MVLCRVKRLDMAITCVGGSGVALAANSTPPNYQAKSEDEVQAVADALSLLANVVMAWNTTKMGSACFCCRKCLYKILRILEGGSGNRLILKSFLLPFLSVVRPFKIKQLRG